MARAYRDAGDGPTWAGAPDPSISVIAMTAPRTRVTCTFGFEAAHRLAWHPGRCRNLHGHSYRLDVSVEGPLDANGVVLDFDTLQDVVRTQVVEPWDHRDLNEVLDNPTAELLAHRAWELLEDAGLTLAALRLWETSDSWVDLTRGAEPAVPTEPAEPAAPAEPAEPAGS